MATVNIRKLRATISVDFDVTTFVEAGEKEKLLMQYAEKLKEEFPNVDLVVTERRERESKKAPTPVKKGKAA